MVDLRIITVSWNVRDRLRECLQSIAETTRGSVLAVEVVVIDNASSDGTVEMVRREFPWVHCIANEENRGFAAACNQGIQATSPQLPAASEVDFFLLLNPDMRVLPGTLEGIVAFMRAPGNERVGIAGCHLVDDQGKTVPHVRRFPTLIDQLAIMLKMPHLVPRILDRYLQRDFSYADEARVDSIRGSFFCIRRALIEEVGYLDEDFFIWFEEVDFCRRAKDAGWDVAYTPGVQCVDYVGQSFAKVSTFRKQRLFTQSMVTYFRKHRPLWQARVLQGVRVPVLAGAWCVERICTR